MPYHDIIYIYRHLPVSKKNGFAPLSIIFELTVPSNLSKINVHPEAKSIKEFYIILKLRHDQAEGSNINCPAFCTLFRK